MDTFVTAENLRSGIAIWRTRRNWSSDFHNHRYAELELRKQADPSLTIWWELALITLGQWKAFRSSKPGSTRGRIDERGRAVLPAMSSIYQGMCASHSGSEPDLATAQWTKLEPLLTLAREIKGVQSWVFPSKLCHLLFPGAVVITDRAVAPIAGGYGEYWGRCQTAWLNCPEQAELIAILRKQIGAEPAPSFPWAAKITELCYSATLVPHYCMVSKAPGSQLTQRA